jgi:hypothetical protein
MGITAWPGIYLVKLSSFILWDTCIIFVEEVIIFVKLAFCMCMRVFHITINHEVYLMKLSAP